MGTVKKSTLYINDDHGIAEYIERAAVLGLILECLVGPIYTWGKDQYPAQGWCLLVPSCEPKTLSTVARHLSKYDIVEQNTDLTRNLI